MFKVIETISTRTIINEDRLDPDLLSHLTVSLVRLSTHHTRIITNETNQLRRLLAHGSLNDSIRVRLALHSHPFDSLISSLVQSSRSVRSL